MCNLLRMEIGGAIEPAIAAVLIKSLTDIAGSPQFTALS
jgi:hypothetical protein